MLSKLWYKDIVLDTIWGFPPDNVAELFMMTIATIIFVPIGLVLIPFDILFSPFYILYWLLSKIRLS